MKNLKQIEEEFDEKANIFIQGCKELKIGDERDWGAMKFAFDDIKKSIFIDFSALLDEVMGEALREGKTGLINKQ